MNLLGKVCKIFAEMYEMNKMTMCFWDAGLSILFADIVGFTAMSAAIGSASKLVEILNELFTSFDNLAEVIQ